MDPFEIRDRVHDYPTELDTPEVEFQYDKINRMVDLFGDVTFDAFFTMPLEELIDTALTKLAMPEIDRRHRAVKGRLTTIRDGYGDLKLIDLPELIEQYPGHPIKTILMELLTLHTALAPFVGQNVPASEVIAAMQQLISTAGDLSYRKLFATSKDEGTSSHLVALASANTKSALLGPKNGRCCGSGVFVCQPRNPDDFCASVNGQCVLASNTNC